MNAEKPLLRLVTIWITPRPSGNPPTPCAARSTPPSTSTSSSACSSSSTSPTPSRPAARSSRPSCEADGITGPQLESLLENRDEYTAERVFWVPPEARWQNLQNQAARPDIATLIDDAILAVERDNPNLKGKLPRDYARRGIAPEKMKGLIDLIADIGFKGDRAKARDTLGRVYEYFLGKFAQAEGKLGGEFFTPRCIVRAAGRDARTLRGPRLRPLLRLGGHVRAVREASSRPTAGRQTDISIFGQESNPTTWRLAHMNLAIRGIEANLGSQPADSFLRDLHPDLKADYILANPPFNISRLVGQASARTTCAGATARRPSATPTTPGSSTSSTTSRRPTAAAAGWPASSWPTARSPPTPAARARSASASSRPTSWTASSRCPPSSSSPPASPSASGSSPATRPARTSEGHARPSRDRKGETLFIDARKLGTMQTRDAPRADRRRRRREHAGRRHGRPAPDSDIGRIVYAFRQWRGEPAPDWWDEARARRRGPYRDIPGFCKAETIEGIGKHGFVLTPGRYVGAEEVEDDGEPFAEKYPRLVAELEECFGEGERLASVVRKAIEGSCRCRLIGHLKPSASLPLTTTAPSQLGHSAQA